MDKSAIRTELMIARYRRLWDDYFPTSQHSSTTVKLTACVTEASALWEASGGMILVCSGGDGLTVAAVRGTGVSVESRIGLDDSSIASSCFTRGKVELVAGTGDGREVLPGVATASAVCLPVLNGSEVRGVLVLLSDENGHFDENDLTPLSLFAYYTAMVLEVDELSDRLGENLTIDQLTGLHNRRSFDRKLRDEVTRASRYSINLSLAVFDIDSLERYNNLCGYTLGNLALSDIAEIFRKGAREVDFVARIGADEFGVILPETTRLGALRFADRVRSDVAAYPFPVADEMESASLTVCAGVANFPSSRTDDLGLLANAYEALAMAKGNGPDNIKLWGELPGVGVRGE